MTPDDLQAYLHHLPTCASRRCGRCDHVADSDLHYVGTPDGHAHELQSCTCGLVRALHAWTAWHRRSAREDPGPVAT